MEYPGTANYSREIINFGNVEIGRDKFHAFKVEIVDRHTNAIQIIAYFRGLALAATMSSRLMNELELDREVIESQSAAWNQAMLLGDG